MAPYDTLTEDMIERRAERQMDHLDQAYMAGEITSDQYDEAVRELCARVSSLYHLLRQSQLATN